MDFRGCELNISITDVYQWFKRNYSKEEIYLKFVKPAHLRDVKDDKIFSFTQLAWRNNGVKSQNFVDEKKALEWLQDTNPGSRQN